MCSSSGLQLCSGACAELRYSTTSLLTYSLCLDSAAMRLFYMCSLFFPFLDLYSQHTLFKVISSSTASGRVHSFVFR